MNGIQELYRLRLAEAIKAGDTSPMMVFPIGEWHSAKYPDLPLTEDLANELIANFEAGVLGTEPVVDSSGRHDTSTPAAGWVKRVYLASYEEGDVTGLALWADVRWTALGATLLTDEQYKYGSVEIGSVVLNDSGETIDNVLRSLTLTNTPVLRLMPGVQNAAEKQRDVVTLSLSEITAYSSTTTEDDGGPAAAHDSSHDSSHDAKVSEGDSAVLAEGEAEPKGSDQMKTVALRLNLAEDAAEATILAEVTKLSEHDAAETKRADAAEVKLGEVEKTARDAAVEVILSDLIAGGHVSPGQKDTWLKLADAAPEQFDAMAETAKQHKIIDLSEHGTGGAGESDLQYGDASIELAEKAKARAAADGLTYTAAEKIVLAEQSDLAERYSEFRMNPRKGA